jgi:hypothetical protein
MYYLISSFKLNTEKLHQGSRNLFLTYEMRTGTSLAQLFVPLSNGKMPNKTNAK